MNRTDKGEKTYITLMPLLMKLKVIGMKRHRISHAAMMVQQYTKSQIIDPSWIPLPVIATYAEFLEFVPFRDKDET